MKTIRWGILGCGDVTEVKSGPGFQKAAGSELVAVMRRNADKAQDYARRHNVPKWYADAPALINDPNVTAVYIATPPGTHEFYAHQVLAAGKPCYIEKPMTRNAPEAQRITTAFAAKKIPLFVAYYRRAMPRFLKVRDLLQTRTLGTLKNISYTYADSQMLKNDPTLPWRLDPKESGGGLFLDLGSHNLDLLDFFFGPLTTLRGSARQTAPAFPVESTADLSFTTPQGTAGQASWNFTHNTKIDEYRFTGDKATLSFSCFGTEPLRLTHADGREESFDVPPPPHVAQPLIQTITDNLRGLGPTPSTGDSALRTQIIMDLVLSSYYGGREDGFWNRPWPGNQKSATL